MAGRVLATSGCKDPMPFGETESTWRFGPNLNTLPKVPHVVTWGGAPLLWPRGSELYRPSHTPPPKAAWFWQPESSEQTTRYRTQEHDRHGRSHSIAAPSVHARPATVDASMRSRSRAAPDAHAPPPSAPAARPPSAEQSTRSHSSVSPSERRARARLRRRQRPRSTGSSVFSEDYLQRDEGVASDRHFATLPSWRDFQRAPAGSGSLTQDFRHAGVPTSWSRSNSSSFGAGDWGGHTLDGGFGRESRFTNDVFLCTGRQSHVPDLRRITHTGPNRVARVC